MEHREYRRMAEASERSWWFRGRRRIVNAAIARLNLPEGASIADIGCGTGANLAMLAHHGAVVGVEPNAAGVAYAQAAGHGVQVVQGTAEATGLGDASQDLVTLLDVLEHLPDEAQALAEVRRILKPGGVLIATVPAFMALWSGHDEALHHHRRYRRGPLMALIADAGLPIFWCSYMNVALFPAVAAVRWRRRLFRATGPNLADTAVQTLPLLQRLFEALFAAERHTTGRLRWPFGVSLLAMARRPSGQAPAQDPE